MHLPLCNPRQNNKDFCSFRLPTSRSYALCPDGTGWVTFYLSKAWAKLRISWLQTLYFLSFPVWWYSNSGSIPSPGPASAEMAFVPSASYPWSARWRAHIRETVSFQEKLETEKESERWYHTFWGVNRSRGNDIDVSIRHPPIFEGELFQITRFEGNRSWWWNIVSRRGCSCLQCKSAASLSLRKMPDWKSQRHVMLTLFFPYHLPHQPAWPANCHAVLSLWTALLGTSFLSWFEDSSQAPLGKKPALFLCCRGFLLYLLSSSIIHIP